MLGELAALAAWWCAGGGWPRTPWQATRSWVAGLIDRGGPAEQAAIEAQHDGHKAPMRSGGLWPRCATAVAGAAEEASRPGGRCGKWRSGCAANCAAGYS